MGDYIERKKAIEALTNNALIGETESGYTWFYTDEVYSILKTTPSADVAPVVHSRWIKTADGAECENCGREAVYQIVDDHWKYEPWCPHCGARMDGEE